MPPRKRKLPQQELAAITEEDDGAPGTSGRSDDVEAEIRGIIDELKQQVESKTSSLIQTARQRSSYLRKDGEMLMAKLTRKIRQTSPAEFFQLKPEEALGSVLSNIRIRLEGGELFSKECSGAAAAAEECATEGPAAGQTEVGTAAHDTAGDPSSQQPGVSNPAGNKPHGLGAGDEKHVGALMPPPPPRAPLAPVNHAPRLPAQDEVVYSKNGSPIFISALLSGAAAPSTVVGKGVAFAAPTGALADATPALFGGPNTAAPAGLLMTGRTFRRGTVAKGRVKQATRAITVTTADGKTFTVDDLIGLASVPAAYKAEVAKLIEADQKDLTQLVQAVQEMEAKSAAATAAPATRTNRRR